MYNLADFQQENKKEIGVKSAIGAGGIGSSILAGKGINDTLKKSQENDFLNKEGKKGNLFNEIKTLNSKAKNEFDVQYPNGDRIREIENQINDKKVKLMNMDNRDKFIRNLSSKGLATLGIGTTIGSLILSNRNKK